TVNSVCNATMTKQAVDHYAFEAQEGQRIVVDCAAKRIDSKLNPVLIVADAKGNDLQVERRGGAIDFTSPDAGTYVIKVHDLTFNGSQEYFYRLVLQEATVDETIPRLPATSTVSSFSWPPPGLTNDALFAETEPNSKQTEAQKITLPCDVSGSFFPAADVDVFEFTAKKGEVWWVEVASERFGL
ncbi:MAG: serine protease, partial [Fuerstiella sp.]|nr:serine protease [Fuerstiella sp.]